MSTPAPEPSKPREPPTAPLLRYVLVGDGESPHLLKWARALSRMPGLQLWAASSRRFMNGFDAVVPRSRQLALGLKPHPRGGNIAMLKALPRLVWWLRRADPHWVHAHYLTSHGTLAWLAMRYFGVRGRLVGSAWGSDILVTPQRSRVLKRLTQRVLQACTLTTSDSQVMATRMRELGAGEVMVFPFGLERLPPITGEKSPWLCFANRGLEPLYRPQLVLEQFSALAAQVPEARLVVAHDGSLRSALEKRARAQDLRGRVTFTGRLDTSTQAASYARSQWYFSLPETDSVSVSVLEAMAQGCIPVVSDLPANLELVRDGDNGIVLAEGETLTRARLEALLPRAAQVAEANREWVQKHALFLPSVTAFVRRLRQIDGTGSGNAPAAEPSPAEMAAAEEGADAAPSVQDWPDGRR